MTIYEVLGVAWIILTSTFATILFFLFAYKGVKTVMKDITEKA